MCLNNKYFSSTLLFPNTKNIRSDFKNRVKYVTNFNLTVENKKKQMLLSMNAKSLVFLAMSEKDRNNWVNNINNLILE